MKILPLQSEQVSLAVTETGAHLSDVIFVLPDGSEVSPMHTAPWAGEPMADDIPPMLQILRGDFFCAPFGASDVIAGQTRAHGETANGRWVAIHHSANRLEANLDDEIMGAAVTMEIEVRPGEPMIYQRHTLRGGDGRLPVGHHAMLYAEHELQLGFSAWIFAGTPPEIVETPPQGRSILKYPQEISDLRSAMLANGVTADLTRYPFSDGHEDLWMLSADPAQPFAWTAATCAEDGWVWFSLKDPRLLPSTTLWLSNGGRTYAPWSSRHRRVIGLEEVRSYFHLGHAASIADNPVAARGIPTALELGGEIAIPYAFGIAPAPAGFSAVERIEAADGGVRLIDHAGLETFAACDLSFVTRPSRAP